mmetsp:Transcript_7889/g.31981  ORF Transcript_7889/g.31981 Transcript_7889/m.31981 type:complete len:316 (-) Transcript_7889:464-1411(-)
MLLKNTQRVNPVVIPAGLRTNDDAPLAGRSPSRRVLSLRSSLECASWHPSLAASRHRNAASGTTAEWDWTQVVPWVAAPWIPSAVHAPSNSAQSASEHASMALRNVRPLPDSAISLALSHMHAHQRQNRANALASGGRHLAPPSRLTCVARRIAATSLAATARDRASNAVVSIASRDVQFAIVAGHAATNAAATLGSANLTNPHTWRLCNVHSANATVSSTRNAGASLGCRSDALFAYATDGFATDRTAVSASSSRLTCTHALPRKTATECARRDHAVTSADVSASASVVSMTPNTLSLSSNVFLWVTGRAPDVE